MGVFATPRLVNVGDIHLAGIRQSLSGTEKSNVAAPGQKG